MIDLDRVAKYKQMIIIGGRCLKEPEPEYHLAYLELFYYQETYDAIPDIIKNDPSFNKEVNRLKLVKGALSYGDTQFIKMFRRMLADQEKSEHLGKVLRK